MTAKQEKPNKVCTNQLLTKKAICEMFPFQVYYVLPSADSRPKTKYKTIPKNIIKES